MLKLKKGQSTLEYVIILAAVVGAVVVAAGMLKDKLSKKDDPTAAYNALTESMVKEVGKVDF